MQGEKKGKSALKLQDRQEANLIEGVEGTDQCASCQRFMSLGEGRFCITTKDEDVKIAEIVGWVTGICDHYLKANNLFDASLDH